MQSARARRFWDSPKPCPASVILTLATQPKIFRVAFWRSWLKSDAQVQMNLRNVLFAGSSVIPPCSSGSPCKYTCIEALFLLWPFCLQSKWIAGLKVAWSLPSIVGLHVLTNDGGIWKKVKYENIPVLRSKKGTLQNLIHQLPYKWSKRKIFFDEPPFATKKTENFTFRLHSKPGYCAQ